MLKQIKALWHKESLMSQVIEQLGTMTENAQYVYTHAWEACKGEAVAAKIAAAVREHDKAVNAGERSVRKLLVEHLTINPGEDVSGSLAVMIITKDLERVGDHGRNIFGIAQKQDGGVPGYHYFDKLDEIAGRLSVMFPKLQTALRDFDEEVAHDILNDYQAVKPLVKTVQKELFDASLDAREAVTTTLLNRYLMRINAHIGNATSGIIFPIENIDFVSRGLRQEEKER